MRASKHPSRRGFDALHATTVREHLINAYARMIYHTMLRDSAHEDQSLCAAVAMKWRGKQLSGRSALRVIDGRDEWRKLSGACTYCGAPAESLDHLIPRLRDGPDSADNLVPVCRWCNSSKGGRDVFEWATSKGFFPLSVVRRYLVLAWHWTERAGMLDQPLVALRPPFRLDAIPWSRSAPVLLHHAAAAKDAKHRAGSH